MHGFFQGFPVVDHLIKSDAPDIFLLQEHWLTPTTIDNFDKFFPDFFTFGCSAMSKQVDSGILRGRPFGGVVMLINNRLRSIHFNFHITSYNLRSRSSSIIAHFGPLVTTPPLSLATVFSFICCVSFAVCTTDAGTVFLRPALLVTAIPVHLKLTVSIFFHYRSLVAVSYTHLTLPTNREV